MRIESTHALNRDRIAVLSGLAVVTLAAWTYLALNARRMPMHDSMSGGGMGDAMGAMTDIRAWTAGTFGLTLVMWMAMMVAMMVPTATPMTLIYAAVARKAAMQQNPVAPTFVFVAGYVAMWSAFSIAATTAQSLLDRWALLSPMMVSNSALLGGGLLIVAGLYQLTPLKRACLEHCRSPAHFIARHWRGGTPGAFVMGLRHGAYCLGCCWALMALLFVGGVMNLLWVAAIAVFVLVEKTLPFAEIGGRIAGGAMVALGVVVAIASRT
jgi:predicted metal-binding membrane protein